jgi:hypothetical protein
MHPTIAASSIHRESRPPERSEPLRAQVLPLSHRPHDSSEDMEVLLLAAQEGIRVEEGNHLPQEIGSIAHDEHESRVPRSAMVLLDPSTAQAKLDEVEDLTSLRILAYVELRHELPTGPRARISLDGNVEGTFSIDVARDVGIQPFLLVYRTCCIVTAHVRRLAVASDTASSAGSTVFPAYSRILGQHGKSYCLTTF